jgi:hypothetical protein
MKYLTLALALFFTSLPSFALSKTGRIGLGLTNQPINDIPSLSMKLQQNRYFALGAILGFRNGENNTEYGAGLKIYRVIFEEELLNFFLSATALTLSFEDDQDKLQSGYQLDGTMGAEFHFEGIESIGFSFEFGISANKGPEGRRIETLGNNLVRAGVHFYL